MSYAYHSFQCLSTVFPFSNLFRHTMTKVDAFLCPISRTIIIIIIIITIINIIIIIIIIILWDCIIVFSQLRERVHNLWFMIIAKFFVIFS